MDVHNFESTLRSALEKAGFQIGRRILMPDIAAYNYMSDQEWSTTLREDLDVSEGEDLDEHLGHLAREVADETNDESAGSIYLAAKEIVSGPLLNRETLPPMYQWTTQPNSNGFVVRFEVRSDYEHGDEIVHLALDEITEMCKQGTDHEYFGCFSITIGKPDSMEELEYSGWFSDDDVCFMIYEDSIEFVSDNNLAGNVFFIDFLSKKPSTQDIVDRVIAYIKQ